MIVAKFGGTSVATKQNAERIRKIILSKKHCKFVVVSALGKSQAFDKKVTDMLFEVYYLYSSKQDYLPLLREVISRYQNLADELNLKINLQKQYEEIIFKLNSKTEGKAYLISRGEYLSALIYSKYLNAQFLDAKDFIIFNKKGEINYFETAKRLKQIPQNKLNVIGGFYGANCHGKIKLFSRGGSDITGAILAKIFDAEIYENYTDVNGVYDKNPKIFKNAKQLPILNYKTAYGMADSGNEIVHKSALNILKNTNTVLIVKNTQNNIFGTVLTSADYIFNNLFACKSNIKILLTKNINKQILNKLKSIGELKRIIFCNNIFLVIFEQIYVNENYLNSFVGNNNYFDAFLFTFFSNIKIEDNNIKQLNKIKNKLKNISIFCDYLSFKNNFVVIIKKEQFDYSNGIINKYLQN